MKHHWDIDELFEHCTLLHQVLAAEVAGQNRLETTRRYSLPCAEDGERIRKGYTLTTHGELCTKFPTALVAVGGNFGGKGA
jgi:hypothetical protein